MDYDHEVIVRALMRRDGMNLNGAVKVFEYNIAEANCGALPPLFIQ